MALSPKEVNDSIESRTLDIFKEAETEIDNTLLSGMNSVNIKWGASVVDKIKEVYGGLGWLVTEHDDGRNGMYLQFKVGDEH